MLGIQTLLDCRSQRASQGGGALPRGAVSRACRLQGVQHQRIGPPVEQGSALEHGLGALRAPLAFARLPAALLCTEADPRNGARRVIGDALAAAGWEVVHLGAQGAGVAATPHSGLFEHPGNSAGWPPGENAIPGLRQLTWPHLGRESLRDAGRCHLRLPWDTELIWVPDWLAPPEADELQHSIEQGVLFHQPVLRFERGLRTIEAQQPRRSAWVSDRFNQPERLAAARAEGQVFEPSVIPAQPLEDWSRKLMERVEWSACAAFNALLLHSYDHGRHSMGLHSDTDAGLGDAAVIASFSLGTTRTFVVKSQAPWEGSRIELRFPVCHGSLLVMGPGFQGRWLHGVLKEPEVASRRLNGTLRFYDLPDGAALCACGASRHSRQGLAA